MKICSDCFYKKVWATKNGRLSNEYCIIFPRILNVLTNPNYESTTITMLADIAKFLTEFSPTAINRSFS
jgi:hypothetical protein